MSAEDVDNTVHYEQLDDLEDDFDQVDLEILRIQDKMTRDLFAKREKTICQIPNFWPLVFERAPPEIDEYIQPTDAAVIASLKSLSVERFELPNGHPRSVSIKFEFAENDYFENTTLEKKFWWRHAKDGWEGMVSEPVDINWKPNKDLTNGLLSLANKIHQEDKAGKREEQTPAKKELIKKLETTSLDAVSFFNFFGFRGRFITEEESREAARAEEEKRKARKEGKEVDEAKLDADEDEDEDDGEYEFEIFPNADDVALTIAEDLWPEAIRYFREGEELAALSEMDFEDEDEDEEMAE
ncbi:uncharacterized protein UV8b_03126 [Ustilaginoidea virens]|uniref:NAP family protein n=1 Tax=Ustilaginoidea virens TaxID=1159556 RepID=A0A8E5HP93_USTVR|nr:uncharacterized protein UV8b_03126 [Ustilaginoidea virens]QUC18885.1 hypothetical protein UV8b_03126 [Ustilaginoidea virens]